ncbi:RNA-guided endonuclease InsQ/TnpB family protein [Microseira sp. BLCC-F43]|jgi:putative transposase|uniref:RNA-guided endonuclease InsQ/TnpB family protein n=1 Tax=Microseira sp. BLCC-F43 TaxID=3153602 RepID=UPI0035B9E46A
MLVLEYKVKGKPSQYRAIEEAIRTVQFVRNKCIRYWMDAPREAKINYARLCNYVTELRNEFSFVQALNVHAGQASAERGWSAISRFYNNCKSKKPGKKGYPRFQKDNRSVEYKTSGWKLHPTCRRITFTDKKGIGELKLLGTWDIHTYPIKSIKRVRLVRRADGFYCQFAINVEVKEQLEPMGNVIGLDVGLEYFYTDSNGYQEENPRFLRKAEAKIKHAQRRIYKKEKGKNGRRKARKAFAKKHLKVSRQRNEHAKRLARNVCKSNDLVAYEDLVVRNMVKNHCLAKSINDASWTQFRQWLEYNACKFERIAVAVSPQYTSQKCSNCGAIVKKSLSVRTHICKCGCKLNRDENAALNILNLALQARGGHPRSNAVGVGVTPLVGENLLEQTLTLITESSYL